MPGILTQPHFQRLEALRRVRHVLQGEEGSISFLKRDALNQLVEAVSVGEGFAFLDFDKDGNGLPAGVRFELQVSETQITLDDVKQSPAVQHGSQRFKILDRFEPANLIPYWRFWVTDLEEVR